MWPKAFHSALMSLADDPKRTKRYLADKRLSFQERTVLECYILLRSNGNQQVVETITKLSPSSSVHTEIQKSIILGMAYNHLAHFELAEKCFLNAELRLQEDDSCPRIRFNIHFSLFLVYRNLHRPEKMRERLEHIVGKAEGVPDGQAKVLHCQFIYFSLTHNKDGAETCIKALDALYPSMTEGMGISHLINSLMYYVREEQFDNCFQILEKMKDHRKYHLTVNFNFIKILLNHLVHDDAIYFTDSEFKPTPVLHYELQVIQSLGLNNKGLAQQYWQKLVDLHPNIYHEDFSYAGEKNLFSLCLKKHLARISSQTPVKSIQIPNTLKTAVEKIYWLLNETSTPVFKDDLFQLVWGKPLETRDEATKLIKTIYRAQLKYGIEIKNRKGFYFLDKLAS